MSKDDLTVRLSQTISPFGVGSVFDVLGQSFVACDTYRWKHHGRQLKLDRLAKSLRVKNFREAPTVVDLPGAPSGPGLPFHRFPEWVFCSSCRRMTKLKVSTAGEEPKCPACPNHPRLVPMRFVMACPSGHLADIDWWYWAHSSGDNDHRCENRTEQLKFKSLAGRGGGLDSLVVEAACGKSRSLARLTDRNGLAGIGMRCPGGQPWQRFSTNCAAQPRAMQRGASNLYFPRVTSAIDIPPDSNFRKVVSKADEIINSNYFADLMANLDEDGNPKFIGEQFVRILSDEFGVAGDEVKAIARAQFFEEKGIAAAVDGDDVSDIDYAEYSAFLNVRIDQDERDGFLTEHTVICTDNDKGEHIPADKADQLMSMVPRVVRATRIREVRALTGFTRIREGGEFEGAEYKVVSPSLGRPSEWLPAIEVFGEGLFLSFNEDYVEAWEQRQTVMARTEEMAARLRVLDWSWLPQPTPRYVALHTLSHLLMRRLTFECGYASASLREKIYARHPGGDGPPMAGVLIYTAAGDSEGSLGGLVRQGEPPRLARMILSAIEDAMWCSADPICSESRSGPGAVNSGACHACSLVAETSCTSANLGLDRTLLIGSAGLTGFMSPLLPGQAATDTGAHA
jgi:hypothetical protein